MNVKKHEFLVKKIKKKLGDAMHFLERKEDRNLLGVLRVVIEEEVGYKEKEGEKREEIE